MTVAGTNVGWLREFKRPGLWLAIWFGLFGLVATGSLVPADDVPTVSIPHFDKVQHFIGYAGLSAYAAMLFARFRTQALMALVVIGFGIALEVAQATLTADRTGDAADVVANSLGALAGMLLSATPVAHWLQRLDARLG
ncbi:MAG: VanZ family protein [Lysobacter sp.]